MALYNYILLLFIFVCVCVGLMTTRRLPFTYTSLHSLYTDTYYIKYYIEWKALGSTSRVKTVLYNDSANCYNHGKRRVFRNSSSTRNNRHDVIKFNDLGLFLCVSLTRTHTYIQHNSIYYSFVFDWLFGSMGPYMLKYSNVNFHCSLIYIEYPECM